MMRILSMFWNSAPVPAVDEECSADHQAVVESVYNHVFENEDEEAQYEDDQYEGVGEASSVQEVQYDDGEVQYDDGEVQNDGEVQYGVQEASSVRVKPMYYPLETQTATETLAHLKQLTAPRYLEETVRKYRGKIRFARLAVPMDPVFYHTFIGAHGYFLQRTCETWDLIAILPIKNELFFWGSRSKIIKAINVLRHRIKICGQRLNLDVSTF